MVFAVLFLIIIPILGIVCVFKANGLNWDTWIIGLFVGVVLFFMGMLGTAFCAGVPGENLYQNGTNIVTVEEKEDKIIALEDNIYVKYYYNDSDIEYVYFINAEKGQKAEISDQDETFILATSEGQQPCVIHKTNRFKNFFLRILFFCPDEYFIYVPEGTIVDQFNIDLQ